MLITPHIDAFQNVFLGHTLIQVSMSVFNSVLATILLPMSINGYVYKVYNSKIHSMNRFIR